MLSIAFRIDVVIQSIKLTAHQDLIKKGPNEVPVLFSPVKVGCFGWPVNHGVTRKVGITRLMLEVVPMFDCLPILKSKNFKANFYDIEVVIGVGKNVVTILKDTHDIHARRCL